MISYRFAVCSSLEKIFPNRTPEPLRDETPLSVFHGERISLQLAYKVDNAGWDLLEEELEISVTACSGIRTVMRKVGLAPGTLPCDGAHDEDYLTEEAGLFPDILYPMEDGRVRAVAGQWRAVWIDLIAEDDCREGLWETEVAVRCAGRGVIFKKLLELRVLRGRLPDQTLIHTEIFHGDCLADYYGVEVFSEEHWSIMENFIKAAAGHGINMILTPLFTPPLDTGVGLERTTIQLVEVEKRGEQYQFSFNRLSRWISLCRTSGITYFEMSHLFTQWGAKAAPKIMAVVDGKEERIFGWETDASGDGYRAFLRQFLPRLTAFLKEEKILHRTWFHVSDEPTLKNLESYEKAHRCMEECLPGCRLLDALSDYGFYEKGIVKHPIVSLDHMEAFLNEGVPNLWGYYCCAQGVDVSNRFFAMPSFRNRILGVQLYLYRIQGFLHWGYNFYNTRFSKKHINPYIITDCGESFPSGDAFLVYPGEDGHPVLSIRMMVLEEALQDMRALQYLETLTSRNYVEGLVEQLAGHGITFKQYPRSAEFLLKLRSRVNQEIQIRMVG